MKALEQNMPPADRRRCLDLRCQSKRGSHLRTDDMKFLERMWKLYPKQYSNIDAEVLELTKPIRRGMKADA
jgi:hypothetical protein